MTTLNRPSSNRPNPSSGIVISYGLLLFEFYIYMSFHAYYVGLVLAKGGFPFLEKNLGEERENTVSVCVSMCFV